MFSNTLRVYKYVIDWDKKTNNFICLHDNNTSFCRLDRNTFNINDEKIRNNIQNGIYSDYHCYRPFKKYESLNNKIYELL